MQRTEEASCTHDHTTVRFLPAENGGAVHRLQMDQDVRLRVEEEMSEFEFVNSQLVDWCGELDNGRKFIDGYDINTGWLLKQ